MSCPYIFIVPKFIILPCPVLCALRPVLCALRPVLCALRPVPCALRPVPLALCPVPFAISDCRIFNPDMINTHEFLFQDFLDSGNIFQG